MAKEVDRALALIKVLTTGKSLVHLEATLGVGHIPELADFMAQDRDTLDKCFSFISEVRESLDTLEAIIGQGFDRVNLADAKAAEGERADAERKAADFESAKKEFLPGMAPPSDPEAAVAGVCRSCNDPILEGEPCFEFTDGTLLCVECNDAVRNPPPVAPPPAPEAPRRGPGRPPGAKNKPKAPEVRSPGEKAQIGLDRPVAPKPPTQFDEYGNPILDREPRGPGSTVRAPAPVAKDDGTAEWEKTPGPAVAVAPAPPLTGERTRRRV